MQLPVACCILSSSRSFFTGAVYFGLELSTPITVFGHARHVLPSYHSCSLRLTAYSQNRSSNSRLFLDQTSTGSTEAPGDHWPDPTHGNYCRRGKTKKSSRRLAPACKLGASQSLAFGGLRFATSSLQPHPSSVCASSFFMPVASQTLTTKSRTALTSSSLAPLFNAPIR